MQKTLLVAVSLIGSGLLGVVQQSPQPVFRAGAEYVPVDVIVTDARDEPITDLKADEFEIYESGRRQTIADFSSFQSPWNSATWPPFGQPRW